MYSTIIRQQHIIDRTEQERHLSLVNILENVFVFIEILFKIFKHFKMFSKGVYSFTLSTVYIYIYTHSYTVSSRLSTRDGIFSHLRPHPLAPRGQIPNRSELPCALLPWKGRATEVYSFKGVGHYVSYKRLQLISAPSVVTNKYLFSLLLFYLNIVSLCLISY